MIIRGYIEWRPLTVDIPARQLPKFKDLQSKSSSVLLYSKEEAYVAINIAIDRYRQGSFRSSIQWSLGDRHSRYLSGLQLYRSLKSSRFPGPSFARLRQFKEFRKEHVEVGKWRSGDDCTKHIPSLRNMTAARQVLGYLFNIIARYWVKKSSYTWASRYVNTSCRTKAKAAVTRNQHNT